MLIANLFNQIINLNSFYFAIHNNNTRQGGLAFTVLCVKAQSEDRIGAFKGVLLNLLNNKMYE